ncbi:MAG: hypothetical protein DMF72_09800 [Acidobacteria bacterium]|nr:MAG: hypothetical protein DMF72_09800 [Acidobacteriota bacterium]
MIRKLEVLANITVIITSIVLCVVIVRNHSGLQQSTPPKATATPPATAAASRRAVVQPGTRIFVPGIDWSKSNRTLLLALSTHCHFCTESAPFFKQLKQRRTDDVRIVAVFPQPVDQAKPYLDKLDLSFEIVQSSLDTLGISGTPTLLLIDRDGAVTESWVGRLSEIEAARVLAKVYG